MKKPIGLLGGTFDPIHFGHLRTALELHQAFDLAEVRLIPCHQPVHRSAPLAQPADRLKMIECAIANEPALTVDDCEIRRTEPSWTINTLEDLRLRLPNTPLCLIIGIDVLATLPQWRRFHDILKLAHIIVAHRPQYNLPQNNDIALLLKNHLTDSATLLQEQLAGYLIFHPVTSLEISATDIRRQFATGQNPRYLLPDAVSEYIQQHAIYHYSDGNTP